MSRDLCFGVSLFDFITHAFSLRIQQIPVQSSQQLRTNQDTAEASPALGEMVESQNLVLSSSNLWHTPSKMAPFWIASERVQMLPYILAEGASSTR